MDNLERSIQIHDNKGSSFADEEVPSLTLKDRISYAKALEIALPKIEKKILGVVEQTSLYSSECLQMLETTREFKVMARTLLNQVYRGLSNSYENIEAECKSDAFMGKNSEFLEKLVPDIGVKYDGRFEEALLYIGSEISKAVIFMEKYC